MSDIVDEAKLIDAREDVETLEMFINGSENAGTDGVIESRLGTNIKTLKRIQLDTEAAVTRGLLPLDRLKGASGAEWKVPNLWYEKTTGNYVPVYRKVFNVGALSDDADVTEAHGLTYSELITGSVRLSGTATDNVNDLVCQLPYLLSSEEHVVVTMDDTNVIVRPNFDATDFGFCEVILEYSKTTDTPETDPVGLGDGGVTKLHKYDGTAAPAITDDDGDGYDVGSMWFDVTNDEVYACVDASTGAAVWKQIS